MSEKRSDQPGAVPPSDEVVLVLTLLAGGRLRVSQQQGRSATAFAAILRGMADRFERGDVERVE